MLKLKDKVIDVWEGNNNNSKNSFFKDSLIFVT